MKSFSEQIKVVAPGERKIMEIPITIPVTERKGEYYAYGMIDEGNYIEEANESNNSAISDKPIVFSDIALVFPEDNHSFAEEGQR